VFVSARIRFVLMTCELYELITFHKLITTGCYIRGFIYNVSRRYGDGQNGLVADGARRAADAVTLGRVGLIP